MITTYLFDLDDTIIDTSVYARMYHELITEIVVNLNISEIDLQKEITKLKQETGKEKVDTYDLCEKLNCTEVYYKVLEKYVKHTYTLKTPAVPMIFKKIKANKRQIGIISASQERTIKLFLDRFNLTQYVDYIESGNKTTVLFWIQLEKKIMLDKNTTLVIDDSDEILQVAEHAGYKVLNVKNINDLEKFDY
jgi:phosphoglycolate phosphatase-like HAD superfamily hydrolase